MNMCAWSSATILTETLSGSVGFVELNLKKNYQNPQKLELKSAAFGA